jgi:hypothetical protein
VAVDFEGAPPWSSRVFARCFAYWSTGAHRPLLPSQNVGSPLEWHRLSGYFAATTRSSK